MFGDDDGKTGVNILYKLTQNKSKQSLFSARSVCSRIEQNFFIYWFNDRVGVGLLVHSHNVAKSGIVYIN